jgi:hypothetical protein
MRMGQRGKGGSGYGIDRQMERRRDVDKGNVYDFVLIVK